MPLYICDVCKFKSSLKGNYFSHLNTLKHRKNTGECITNKVIKFEKPMKISTNKHKCPKSEHKHSTNDHKHSTNDHKISTNVLKTIKKTMKPQKKLTQLFEQNGKNGEIPQNPENSAELINPQNPQNPQNLDKFICNHCNKIFKSNPNLKRHIKLYCKELKKKEADVNLLKKIEELEKKHEKEKTELYKKLEQLIDKVGNTTNNITNNTQNIILNNYGNEDMSHISDNLKTQLLKIPYAMIPKMIEAVHFNKNKPENKNIVLPNKNDNKLKIYKDNKWVYKNKLETINDLVDGKYFILDSHYDIAINSDNDLSPFVKMNYLKFRKFYDEGDKELIEQVNQECELVLLNNR